MYKLESINLIEDGITDVRYGASDSSGNFFELTNDYDAAVRTVSLLNENKVELCHVMDVIEDIFYS